MQVEQVHGCTPMHRIFDPDLPLLARRVESDAADGAVPETEQGGGDICFDKDSACRFECVAFTESSEVGYGVWFQFDDRLAWGIDGETGYFDMIFGGLYGNVECTGRHFPIAQCLCKDGEQFRIGCITVVVVEVVDLPDVALLVETVQPFFEPLCLFCDFVAKRFAELLFDSDDQQIEAAVHRFEPSVIDAGSRWGSLECVADLYGHLLLLFLDRKRNDDIPQRNQLDPLGVEPDDGDDVPDRYEDQADDPNDDLPADMAFCDDDIFHGFCLRLKVIDTVLFGEEDFAFLLNGLLSQ